MDFKDTVKRWMYSFTYAVETQDEEKISMAKLNEFVRTAPLRGVSGHIVRQTQKFIRESFETCLAYISHYRYLTVPEGDRDHNCAVEADFSSLKRDDRGTRANQALDFSLEIIYNRDRRYLKRKEREWNNSMITRRMENNGETHRDKLLRQLSAEIVDNKAAKAVQEHILSKRIVYSIRCVQPNEPPHNASRYHFHVQAPERDPPADTPWCQEIPRVRYVAKH